MKLRSLVILAALAGLAAAAYQSGVLRTLKDKVQAVRAAAPVPAPEIAPPPAVSVVPVALHEFVETVLVTGSLVAREEVMVAPEVDGLRVLEIRADEGDRVRQGDVLAVLVYEQLDAQLAQNEAALARASAAIARAKSQIVEAEARSAEAGAALERARPLVKSQFLSESVFDERQAAAKTAAAQLAAAQDGLSLAEAEKAQVEAQRRELLWRRGNTEVRAPTDGVVSRRSARVGSIAIGAFVAGGGDPMFRIISNGEIELDGEVPETRLAKVARGQTARVEAAGAGSVEGRVRLVSPEVDKATRLGRVRIFLGDRPGLRVGAFARGSIETARAKGLAVPQSAVLYGSDGATVQVVGEGKVETRRLVTGLSAGGLVEVRSGLAEGELVVAKAGTFLRDGDAVRSVLPGAEISEAGR
jgi:RND family efflux transporter MFP subunit